MSKLIRREDAIKITWIEPQYSDPINVLTEVRDRIEALPTVDAVPVVRCKDCKHTKEDGCGAIYCKVWDRWEMPEDYFCADGERR